MSLLEIKNLLVEATGREDLLDAGTRIGATFLINEGQKYLDRKFDMGKAMARYHYDLSVDEIVVPLPGCRAVKEVWIHTASERTRLTKYSMEELRDEYGLTEPVANMDKDIPTYYAIGWIRPYPNEVVPSSYNQEWAFEDVIDLGHEGFNGIVILPPPDVATYTLEVVGLFYSDELVNDSDTSFWSEQHPLTLVKAAMYILEGLYRNSEGVRDIKFTLDEDVHDILADYIEEEVVEIDQMEG